MLLFCALTGCTSPKSVHPEIAPCTLPIYSNNIKLKKREHSRCTPLEIVHPAMEICTPGAGWTLNLGHCGPKFGKVPGAVVSISMHPAKCAHRVQGAPLISKTEYFLNCFLHKNNSSCWYGVKHPSVSHSLKQDWDTVVMSENIM